MYMFLYLFFAFKNFTHKIFYFARRNIIKKYKKLQQWANIFFCRKDSLYHNTYLNESLLNTNFLELKICKCVIPFPNSKYYKVGSFHRSKNSKACFNHFSFSVYVCPVASCGKVYKHRASLYNHRRYECGKEKIFNCLVSSCLYKAKRKFTMKKHMAIVHGIFEYTTV